MGNKEEEFKKEEELLAKKKEEKRKKNFYFDEEKVTAWIEEYQKSAVIEKKEGEKDVVLWKDIVIEEKITIEVKKIVNAIIHNYSYYRFEPYEDCMQHGLMSCFTNFLKWTPSKGTAFNYFSIISKRSILNYTERKQKHRNYEDITDHVELHANSYSNFEFFIENFQTSLLDIVNENYEEEQKELFTKIAMVLCEYLALTRKFVSKTDFYSFAKPYGIRSLDVREFVKELSTHHGAELFEGTL